jgi:hypothetical protein
MVLHAAKLSGHAVTVLHPEPDQLAVFDWEASSVGRDSSHFGRAPGRSRNIEADRPQSR